MIRESKLDMGSPETPKEPYVKPSKEDMEPSKEMQEALKIWDLMAEKLPEEAGFHIDHNILAGEKRSREEILTMFNDNELIGFIQNNPELIKKILTLQGLLEGTRVY